MNGSNEQNEVFKSIPAVSPSNAFRILNDYDLVSLEHDKAVFRLELHPESLNTYGLPHGGILFAIADEAGGAAAHTDGRFYVTQNCSFNFLKTQSHGILYAMGQVRRRGKAVVLVETDVINETGDLLATGQFSYHCIANDLDEQKEKLRQKQF